MFVKKTGCSGKNEHTFPSFQLLNPLILLPNALVAEKLDGYEG